jgi:DNA repair photolyase
VALIIKEKAVKTVLSKTGIPGASYCLNPYTGCVHGCLYCYAEFMKKYTGHTEPWGSFVDIKANAPEVLQRQLRRAEKGRVLVSSVTDPYQPLEAKTRLTRRCLEVLLEHQFPVDILTKSPLVTRDIDLFRKFKDIEVGLTITTDMEKVRKVFEPHAPPIGARLGALRALHKACIGTYVFIGPLLPMDPEALAEAIRPYAGSVLIDRMNYQSKTRGLFERMGWAEWLDEEFTQGIIKRLRKGLGRKASLCY